MEPTDVPPSTVLLPLESVTTQVSGLPLYSGHASSVPYAYEYMGFMGNARADVHFVETTIQTKTEIALAKTLSSTDERGTRTEYPRTATVFTAEAGGRHLLALYAYATHQSDFEPGRQLFFADFSRLKFVDESDQPIRIVAIAENPVNVLNITYTVATGVEKKLHFSLDDSANRLLKQ